VEKLKNYLFYSPFYKGVYTELNEGAYKTMAFVFLGLGANVGDCEQTLHKAIRLLGEKVSVRKKSSLMRSRAMYIENQPDFFNMVIAGDTALTPPELLTFTQGIERTLGRVKTFRNGPRVIDVDIIAYDDLVYADEVITVPHPLYSERLFVLQPLLEICPSWICPRTGKTLERLLGDLAAVDDAPALLYKSA
jgi:2-amino-4-hydroxy-6-hydroxymethyldihydropteridine diphosphokinase